MPILRLQDLTRQFAKGDRPAVNHISLSLPQGYILALLGPSGCGKTTLLRLIAGFEAPQSGTIELAGQTVSAEGRVVPPEQRSVGMVFQDFALFPHLTVADNIGFGLTQSALKPKIRKDLALVQQQVTEAIALVGLQGKADRYPHELSGGQQQRVALARALAPRPTLVLLDEPLSNLDVQVRLTLRQEVRDILKATGTSAIFVTHDQEEAMAIADQIAVMRQGQIEQLGTPEQVYQTPASRFVAEFVTQANLLPAQFVAPVWETEIGSFAASAIALPPETASVIESHPASSLPTATLMIRQEDLQVEPDTPGNAVVSDRQFLGREYRYSLTLPSGARLYARTPTRTLIPIGSSVQISVEEQPLRCFPNPVESLSLKENTSLDRLSPLHPLT